MPRRIPETVRLQVIRDLQDGLTQTEAGRRNGVSNQFVSVLARQAGIPALPKAEAGRRGGARGRRTDQVKRVDRIGREQIRAERANGKRLADLAKQFGVNVNTIKKYLREAEA